MADKSKDSRDRAEAQFEKRQKAERERDAVWMENAAAARAVDQKTARLRALRLAKEAADAEAAAVAAQEQAAAAPKKPARKAKRA